MIQATSANHDHNQAIFKLSPFKKLSQQQLELRLKIIRFCRVHVPNDQTSLFVIQGDAGTGKSVVLNSVFNEIQTAARAGNADDSLANTRNYLIVNHSEMIKLYKEIAEQLPNVRKKDFIRPTSFINQMRKSGKRADVVLIDEAHLLLTKSDRYNRFYQANQLEEILKRSRAVVMVFDEKQVLKLKSYWNESNVQAFMKRVPHEHFYLTNQFRMRAQTDVLNWIDAFIHKKILPFPKKQPFDFRIFADAGVLYQVIKARNSQYHLSRLIATYDYPYTLDGSDYYIDEPNFHLRWDRSKTAEKQAWAERADTIDEVGSVYTIQGFDLNYAGVILDPSVSYDETSDRIVIRPERYQDGAAFIKRNDVAHLDNVKEQIILNSINVLMTRAVHGLYLYASDLKLRGRLVELQTKRNRT
ncbi:DUF2075 domain-containing protein [Sporolactobacillus shoreicorticis]|uniref:DUF2075 domain-containing protein n=1 Tax=Sporolactobacillus shoreicorticis TaxID=1923877 RepID=A0ABW5S6U1_9BACL|nr:DUF2075 domain-containing protein [Sporolactobacillus shoreicorticis]MCO7127149.1 DUF2075 domain-containing protein [Sporolactobacillus shoreicorticis]